MNKFNNLNNFNLTDLSYNEVFELWDEFNKTKNVYKKNLALKRILRFDKTNVIAKLELMKLKNGPYFLEELLKLRKDAINALLSIDRNYFLINNGYFYAIPETRPYMHVNLELYNYYIERNRIEEAKIILEESLLLSHSDELGMRYNLILLYFSENNYSGIEKLINFYKKDEGIEFVLMECLKAYLIDKKSRDEVLTKLFRHNVYLFGFLSGFLTINDEVVSLLKNVTYYKDGTAEEGFATFYKITKKLKKEEFHIKTKNLFFFDNSYGVFKKVFSPLILNLITLLVNNYRGFCEKDIVDILLGAKNGRKIVKENPLYGMYKNADKKEIFEGLFYLERIKAISFDSLLNRYTALGGAKVVYITYLSYKNSNNK